MSQKRGVIALLLERSFRAVTGNCICFCLSLFVFFVAGYLCNIDAALEHYCSWPYATMGSEHVYRGLVECASKEDARLFEAAVQSSGLAGICESAVYAQAGDRVFETKAYGVLSSSPEALDRTKFNKQALGDFRIERGGAVLSSDIARELGLKEGDRISFWQSGSSTVVVLKVMHVVRAYGATAGILVPASYLEGFRWDALELYGDEVPTSVEELLYEEPVAYSKKDACADAKTQAREFLPFAATNLKQQLAFVLGGSFSLVLFARAERELRRRLHNAMRCVGCPLRALGATMVFSFCITGLLLALVGAGASGIVLHTQYGMSQSAFQFGSTVVLLASGALAASVVNAVLWRWHLRI